MQGHRYPKQCYLMLKKNSVTVTDVHMHLKYETYYSGMDTDMSRLHRI